MSNPWLKKNPFMSIWLSGASAVAGSLRGHGAGEAERQAATAISTATKCMVDAWIAGLVAPPPKKRKRRQATGSAPLRSIPARDRGLGAPAIFAVTSQWRRPCPSREWPIYAS
jgi:hypothetical protein